MDTYFGPGSGELYSSTVSIKLHSWNHYCSARSGTKVQLFMDGEVIKTGNTGGPNAIKAGKWYLGTHVGARHSSGQYFVHGSMCSFRVYDRALTEKQIKVLYDGGACF